MDFLVQMSAELCFTEGSNNVTMTMSCHEGRAGGKMTTTTTAPWLHSVGRGPKDVMTSGC